MTALEYFAAHPGRVVRFRYGGSVRHVLIDAKTPIRFNAAGEAYVIGRTLRKAGRFEPAQAKSFALAKCEACG
jgi:hypothetical protein